MPKQNTVRITEAQRQRVNIQKKSEKYGPSTVYLQVLGSGTQGSPNTLYLFTDQKRYLFNCGESTQRLAHEHKVKLSRLNDIFITSKSWKNLGGLPGLSLTLQDVGVPNITLHGPEGLDELYNATKRFVTMKEMNVTMANCSSTEDFEDNAITVKYVLFDKVSELLKEKPTKKAKHPNPADKAYEEFIHDETNYYCNEPGNEHCRSAPKVASPPKKDVRLPEAFARKKNFNMNLHDKTNCHVAYICTLKKRLGTLDLAKCVELGVKPGPLLGQLKSGQDICLHDGRIIRSEEVKTPDDPGPVFIVLELPDISYLKESRYFDAHFDNGKNPREKIPSLIVHFTQPHVLHAPEYKVFMQKFGPTTQHLILNDLNSCLGSEAVHRTQHKLHMLDPKIFPLLKDLSVPPLWDYAPLPPTCTAEQPERIRELDELKNRIALAQFQSIVTNGGSRGEPNKFAEWEKDGLNVAGARSLTTYHFRPKKELDRSLEPKLRIQEYICEPMDVSGFYGALKTFLQKVKDIRGEDNPAAEFPRVIFLGTGSCIPSKTRNTSGIVVQMNEENSILLDCGEGTLCQLVRFFGPKKINTFLRSLKAAYISHLHADHHIGLIGVLQARRKALEELGSEAADASPLYLLAPGQIMSWLTLYDLQFERIRKDFSLVPNQGLLCGTSSAELTPAVLAAIGLRDVKTCLVSHCPNAFGVALFLDAQHKITYSGDTIPCPELIKLGFNSHLLIHEATMEDELEAEARLKMHSTMSQAVEVGKAMAAKYIILTHFSQRYARIPRLHPTLLVENENVGIAFDNMMVSMQDLPLLSHMYAPLQLMFAEHYAEMELKAVNRAQKKGLDQGPKAKVAASYRESHASRLRRQCGAVETRSTIHSTVSSMVSKSTPPAMRSHSLTPAIKPISVMSQQEGSAVMLPRNVRSLCSSPTRQKSPPSSAKMRAVTPPLTQDLPRWKWSVNATGSIQSSTRSSAESKKKMELLPSKIPRRVPSPQKMDSLVIKKEESSAPAPPSKTSAKPMETKAVRPPSGQKRAASARSPSRPKTGENSSRKDLQKPHSARKPYSKKPTSAKTDAAPRLTTIPLPSTATGSPPRQRVQVTKKKSSDTNTKESPTPSLDIECNNSTPKIIPPVPSTPTAQTQAIVPKSSSTPAAAKTRNCPKLTSASSVRPKNVTLRSGLSKYTVPSTTDTKQSLLPKAPSAVIPYSKQPVAKSPIDKIVSSVSANKCSENDVSKEMLNLVSQLPASISTTSFVIETQNSTSKFTTINNRIMVMTMEQQNDDESAISRTLEITHSTTSTTSISRKDLSATPKSLVAHRRVNSIFNGNSRLNTVKNSVVTKTLNMTSTTTIQKKNLSSHRSSFNNGKCYKPQLADIQSSCFLLKKPEAAACRKQLSIDEEAVRQRLMAAKRKFTSREYCNQSKYDKIEGLNWISWK